MNEQQEKNRSEKIGKILNEVKNNSKKIDEVKEEVQKNREEILQLKIHNNKQDNEREKIQEQQEDIEDTQEDIEDTQKKIKQRQEKLKDENCESENCGEEPEMNFSYHVIQAFNILLNDSVKKMFLVALIIVFILVVSFLSSSIQMGV